MSNPFIITEHEKCITITWPSFADINMLDTKIKLVEAAFREALAYEVGFCVKLENDEFDILWIDSQVQYQKNDYTRYLLDMYDVKGVAFRSRKEADMFHKWIESKYIWHLLTD